MKVFVLTEQGQGGENNEVTLNVADVFSTKTAAKECLRERRGEIISFYESEYDGDYEISFDDPVLFSITCKSSCVWNELSITEKDIKL